ncbi:hypothetical protein GCM10020331_070420 [Ectobacillus funiculus]
MVNGMAKQKGNSSKIHRYAARDWRVGTRKVEIRSCFTKKIFKFSTLFSMFLSIGAYAIVYGWKFAVALVALLAIHEGGHGVAARMKGIPTSPALFIPFMGGCCWAQGAAEGREKRRALLDIWVRCLVYFRF